MAHATTLYFFKMTGCPFCDEAAPEVAKLARANPLLAVVTKDLTKDQVAIPVPIVPAFALVLPSGQAYMTDAEKLPDTKAPTLAGWIRDVRAGKRPTK